MSCHKPMLADLREHGVRLTAQRALILEDLYHHPGHCTADAIFARVSQNLPGLNRATVYRTLELLHAAGVVSASSGPEGVNVMSYCTKPINSTTICTAGDAALNCLWRRSRSTR
jgi:Fe2+ or Zn2+ uptake regulation protein